MTSVKDVIAGLEVLARYTPSGVNDPIGRASRDELYGPHMISDVTAADRRVLVQAGWCQASRDSWMCYI